MQMRSSGARRYAIRCAMLALTLPVIGCAASPSTGPGTDCSALGRAPVTLHDADTVSDELALWLATAAEVCGW